MNFEKSFQEIVFDMMMDGKYMFYGLFLAELNKSFEDDLPTACVGKHHSSNNISLMLGKKWWEKTCWNNSRKTWTLIHELEHVMREHLSEVAEGMYPDRKLANIAMDMSINQCIPNEEAPDPNEDGVSQLVFFENFAHLKMEPMQSSLYYYNRLSDAKQEKKDSKKRNEDSQSPYQQPGNGRGTSGSPELDKWLDSDEDGTMVDWHKHWDDLINGMGDKEKDLFKKEIQEAVRRVAEETQKMQGHVPVHVSNSVNANFGNKPPVISWKTLFNRFVGSTLSTEVFQTRKRPNFRFEDAPVHKYKNKVRIVVGLDTSGSVSEEELKEFFGQVKHMWKAGVKVDICLWDASCEDAYEYKENQPIEGLSVAVPELLVLLSISMRIKGSIIGLVP